MRKYIYRPFYFLIFIGLIFLNFLMILKTDVMASNAIVAQSYFEDPTSTLTFDDIKTKDFFTYSGLFNKGYSQSTFWIRLDLDPQAARFDNKTHTEPLVLRLMPSFLDEIELYDPANYQTGRRLIGNKYSGREDEYHSNNFNFILGNITESRSVWLRVKSVSTMIVLAEALPLQNVATLDITQNFLFGIYFGIIIISFLITFYIYVLNRDRTVLVFSIKQVSQLIWSLFNIGYIRYFIDELPFGILISEFRHYPGALTVFLSMLFDYMFLRNFGSRRWGQILQIILMIFVFVTVICFATGNAQAGLKLNIFLIWGFTFLSVLLAITTPPTRRQDSALTGNVPKGVLIFSYALIASILLLAILPYLGLANAVSFSLNAFIYHGLISAVALAALLGFRARSQLIRQFELAKALQVSQSLAEEERSNRKEQSRFLSMLSHELKTPLAGIRMVLGLRDAPDKNDRLIEQAVDDIDSVIRLCLEVEKVDDGAIILHKVNHRLDETYLRDIVAERDRDRLSINLDAEADLVTDPRYVSILIANLLSNALKYSPDDTPVEVQGGREFKDGKAGFVLSIANIPNRKDWPDPARVFTKYYRSPQAHRKTGSGLGLYLVAQLCRMLGCEVRYLPDERVVRFVVWFPV